MSVSVVDQFTASLETVGVYWTKSTKDELETHLEAVIEPPVVGSDFEVNGTSLDALDLTEDVVVDPSVEELRSATTGITLATFGIAEYGSLVLRTDDMPGAESASLFTDNHVAILAVSDILPDMTQALQKLGPLCREQTASAIIATGPSATADMGALVYGAHGPMAVHVIILEDQ